MTARPPVLSPGLEPGAVPGPEKTLAGVVLAYLGEMVNGRCAITEEMIARETDPQIQEIFAGLLWLHEDLEFRRQEWERAVGELKSTQEALLQSAKMAAVGQLAAGVAHEINNPLAVILGFAQGLDRRVGEGHPLRMPVTSIVREAVRCKNLVEELLTFSRVRNKKTQTVDLSVVARSALLLLGSRARTQSVQIVGELAESLPALEANPTQLQQIVVNLGNNSLDSMPGGGTLTVRTSTDGDGHVSLEVADSGAGISPDARSRIFEPFFTTKEVGRGTGLGLSLVHEIVQQHGGAIEVQSTVGLGTLMRVRLPIGAT